MFKGLRTKIESEQKGQGSERGGQRQTKQQSRTTKPTTRQNETSQPKIYSQRPDAIVNSESKSDALHSSTSDERASPISISNRLKPNNTPTSTQDGCQHTSFTADQNLESLIQFEENFDVKASGIKRTSVELESQIARVQNQLKAVIKEREDFIRQLAQSNQLIDSIQQALEQERAKNSSLEARLRELEQKKQQPKQQFDNKDNNKPNSVFSKSLNLEGLTANASDLSISDNVDVLRQELIQLQAQLAKKNRQLKIKQQNLTDMKKALQREILEHGKTQDELVKAQRQFRGQQEQTTPTNNSSDSSATINVPNGSDPNESVDIQKDSKNHESSQTLSDKNQGNGHRTSSGVNISEDAISLNAAVGIASQFDRISCMSRSSASVDDFESNDFQQNNYNKEVSHEYLRNVLFRYMTSTDTETTQHLVKAISVLMDFTPEQSAAIKNSINNRMSSWLRLK